MDNFLSNITLTATSADIAMLVALISGCFLLIICAIKSIQVKAWVVSISLFFTLTIMLIYFFKYQDAQFQYLNRKQDTVYHCECKCNELGILQNSQEETTNGE